MIEQTDACPLKICEIRAARISVHVELFYVVTIKTEKYRANRIKKVGRPSLSILSSMVPQPEVVSKKQIRVE